MQQLLSTVRCVRCWARRRRPVRLRDGRTTIRMCSSRGLFCVQRTLVHVDLPAAPQRYALTRLSPALVAYAARVARVSCPRCRSDHWPLVGFALLPRAAAAAAAAPVLA
jgi:hypothetical protein